MSNPSRPWSLVRLIESDLVWSMMVGRTGPWRSVTTNSHRCVQFAAPAGIRQCSPFMHTMKLLKVISLCEYVKSPGDQSIVKKTEEAHYLSRRLGSAFIATRSLCRVLENSISWFAVVTSGPRLECRLPSSSRRRRRRNGIAVAARRNTAVAVRSRVAVAARRKQPSLSAAAKKSPRGPPKPSRSAAAKTSPGTPPRCRSAALPFHHQRVPLVILVCGTACVGKSTISSLLAQRLNLPNVLKWIDDTIIEVAEGTNNFSGVTLLFARFESRLLDSSFSDAQEKGFEATSNDHAWKTIPSLNHHRASDIQPQLSSGAAIATERCGGECVRRNLLETGGETERLHGGAAGVGLHEHWICKLLLDCMPSGWQNQYIDGFAVWVLS
nr:2-phosphoglycerate kinase [Ipomoea batatas]